MYVIKKREEKMSNNNENIPSWKKRDFRTSKYESLAFFPLEYSHDPIL
jgi:hypothetical protein